MKTCDSQPLAPKVTRPVRAPVLPLATESCKLNKCQNHSQQKISLYMGSEMERDGHMAWL